MKKSTIILIGAVIVCLLCSVVSAKGSVTRAKEAIAGIGDVTYTEECKEKLDRAVEYYNALDDNLKLKDKITDTKEFDAAKVEYVRLAIKAAKVADTRKIAESYSSADVNKLVTEAREAADTYLTKDQYSLVENYAELTTLEASYSSGTSSDDAGEAATVPMC